MSVIIKGIDVPESCNKCPFAELDVWSYALWTCKFSGGDVTEELFSNAYSFRPEWCPVGELPKKHGRLIDADDAKRRMIPLASFSVQKWLSEVELSNCVTIFEAEEE